MGWLARKLDEFVGAALAGTAGVGMSQLQAFIHQYLQRLGGHLDEARRTLDRVAGAAEYAGLERSARDLLIQSTTARVRDLEDALAAIRDAGPVSRPFAFARNLDADIALAAARDFQPAIPLDVVSLAYAAAGMLATLILYDLFKAPFRVAFGRRGA